MKQLWISFWNDLRRVLARIAPGGQLEALHQAQAVIEFALDGTILDANDNFLRIMGYARHEVVGHHHGMFIDPAERASEAYRAFWAELRSGRHHTGQYRRLARGGREVWIQGSYSSVRDRRGRPCKVVKYAIDVTAQRLQAADMEGQLAAIDRAQAVISFALDGTILEANDNFLVALGYRRDEVVGRHHRLFVDAATRESPDYRRFWERLREGHYHSGLFPRVRKDGSEAWIQATYNPIFDLTGRPVKIVKYAIDVTERTRAVQALQHALGSLARTVPAIAGEAQNASRLARDASGSASSGGAVVSALVDTIGGIHQRAKNMAEIIAVMDAIAFQTSILALNAAVEAAHAGERGQGFGVVAQEVRELARRSAQSARDIRDLVHNAIDALAEGSSRAQQAGATMEAIVASVLDVDRRIGQIAGAAEAQAGGIDQVRLAIERLQAGTAAA